MFDLDEKYGTDKSAENEGVWIYLNDDETAGFKLARMSRSNKKYAKQLSKEMSRHKRALQLGTLSDEKAAEIELRVFVDTIIKDWKGIAVNGKELPFNKENAIKILSAYDDLYTLLRNEADNMEAFKKSEMESKAKN